MQLILPKKRVIELGYIGAIAVFLITGIILAMVFIPKLTKPVAEIPSAKLEASVQYPKEVSIGDQWFFNVSVVENSPAVVHNIVVKIKSNLTGEQTKTYPFLQGYGWTVFTFYGKVENVSAGEYPVLIEISANEMQTSNQTVYVTVK